MDGFTSARLSFWSQIQGHPHPNRIWIQNEFDNMQISSAIKPPWVTINDQRLESPKPQKKIGGKYNIKFILVLLWLLLLLLKHKTCKATILFFVLYFSFHFMSLVPSHPHPLSQKGGSKKQIVSGYFLTLCRWNIQRLIMLCTLQVW